MRVAGHFRETDPNRSDLRLAVTLDARTEMVALGRTQTIAGGNPK
jgi:hypothetical protein